MKGEILTNATPELFLERKLGYWKSRDNSLTLARFDLTDSELDLTANHKP